MTKSIRRGSKENLQEVRFGPKTRFIPDDWDIGKIGDNTYLKGRIGWHGLTEDDHLDEGEYYLVTGTDFENGRVNWSDCKYVNEEWYNRDEDIQLKEDDILVTKDGSIGKVALVEELPGPATLNNGILLLRPLNGEYIPEYMYYVLNSFYFEDFIETITAGSTISHLYEKDFVNFRFPLPPIPEQERIAEILGTADDIIRKSEEVGKELTQIQKGMVGDLVPRGITESGKIRPGPNESPELYNKKRRYSIPGDWAVSTLQDLCTADITYGIVQAGPHIENGVPYLKTGDVTGDGLNIGGLERTSPDIAADYSRSRLEEGELVMTIRATVGVVKQVPPELEGANLTQGTARISPNDSIDNRYLLWALRSNAVQDRITGMTKGSTFSEITLGALRTVPIPHPIDNDEQQKIAERLDCIDHRLKIEREYLSELKQFRRGLMQDLLTGKVRTPPDFLD